MTVMTAMWDGKETIHCYKSNLLLQTTTVDDLRGRKLSKYRKLLATRSAMRWTVFAAMSLACAAIAQGKP